MAMISVAWRAIIATSVTLSCLGPSRLSSARLVEGKQTLLGSRIFQDVQAEGPKACGAGSFLDLQGSSTTFQFSCPPGAKLDPAEEPGSKAAQSGVLEKVYQFAPTQARDKPECAGQTTTLKALVPGSTLVKVTQEEHSHLQNQQDVQASTLFNLTIGQAQQQTTHFCYVCTSAAGGEDTVDRQGPANCTVYVTVPEKNAQPPSDEHSGSVSFSPSVFGWLSPTVGGCALGLMLRP